MCFRKYLLILFFVQILEYSNGQKENKFFRKDYRFIENTQSFYKIHTIHKNWYNARKTCSMEGATLFYADNDVEFGEVVKFWNNTQRFPWIYVGISDLIAKGVFETIDGVPVIDVYNNWEPGEPNDANGIEDCVTMGKDGLMNDVDCNKRLPFICKKNLNTLKWNKECDMPYTDYVYSDNFGRCYKFGSTPKNWTEAYTLCSAELSYLAIINEKEEADFLVKFTEDAKKRPVDNNYVDDVIFLGFHNRNKDGWTTIRGKSLEDSGYALWAKDQPDGVRRNVEELCGSMFKNGQLNDVQCENKCYFICEHEVSVDIGNLERLDD